MANLMQDLFDHIELSKTSFDALNQRMKEVVLGQIKRGSPRLIVKKMNTSASLTFACFEKSEIFSGNLDAKAIREKLREIGVAGCEKYKERALLTVKTERNNLAHGNKFFSDCGKDYTVKELSNFQNKTCSTLEKVIKDLEQFMASKSYA